MCKKYGHGLDQNDNVYIDMVLNNIFKLIKTTDWNEDVMIVEIMKHLQQRHLLYTCTWVISP